MAGCASRVTGVSPAQKPASAAPAAISRSWSRRLTPVTLRDRGGQRHRGERNHACVGAGPGRFAHNGRGGWRGRTYAVAAPLTVCGHEQRSLGAFAYRQVDRPGRAGRGRDRDDLAALAGDDQVRWPRSSPRCSMSAPVAPDTRGPLRAGNEMEVRTPPSRPGANSCTCGGTTKRPLTRQQVPRSGLAAAAAATAQPLDHLRRRRPRHRHLPRRRTHVTHPVRGRPGTPRGCRGSSARRGVPGAGCDLACPDRTGGRAGHWTRILPGVSGSWR